VCCPISQVDFRELDYTHAGDFDSAWLAPRRINWLKSLHSHGCVERPLEAASWRGRNTFVQVHPELVAEALPFMAEAVREENSDTRVSVLLSAHSLESTDMRLRLAEAGHCGPCGQRAVR
jgi:hypothetical protein